MVQGETEAHKDAHGGVEVEILGKVMSLQVAERRLKSLQETELGRGLALSDQRALSEVSRLAIPKAGQNSSYTLDCTDPTV
jgi:hypothetical protein